MREDGLILPGCVAGLLGLRHLRHEELLLLLELGELHSHLRVLRGDTAAAALLLLLHHHHIVELLLLRGYVRSLLLLHHSPECVGLGTARSGGAAGPTVTATAAGGGLALLLLLLLLDLPLELGDEVLLLEEELGVSTVAGRTATLLAPALVGLVEGSLVLAVLLLGGLLEGIGQGRRRLLLISAAAAASTSATALLLDLGQHLLLDLVLLRRGEGGRHRRRLGLVLAPLLLLGLEGVLIQLGMGGLLALRVGGGRGLLPQEARVRHPRHHVGGIAAVGEGPSLTVAGASSSALALALALAAHLVHLLLELGGAAGTGLAHHEHGRVHSAGGHVHHLLLRIIAAAGAAGRPAAAPLLLAGASAAAVAAGPAAGLASSPSVRVAIAALLLLLLLLLRHELHLLLHLGLHLLHLLLLEAGVELCLALALALRLRLSAAAVLLLHPQLLLLLPEVGLHLLQLLHLLELGGGVGGERRRRRLLLPSPAAGAGAGAAIVLHIFLCRDQPDDLFRHKICRLPDTDTTERNRNDCAPGSLNTDPAVSSGGTSIDRSRSVQSPARPS